MDLSRTQILVGVGEVTFIDASTNIDVRMEVQGGRVVTISIGATHGGSVTRATMDRIPIGQLTRIATAILVSGISDAMIISMVCPQHDGQRSWPDEHWRNVLKVIEWAERTRRPGGPTQAIADLWGVTRRPTAYRWLKRARQTSEMT